VNKSEMEEHRESYDACMAQADDAIRAGRHREALATAVSALQFTDGMMRHAAKYDNAQFDNVQSIELILRYAPLLLEQDPLKKLEETLDAQRRIERTTSENIRQLLGAATKNLAACHRLWSLLESIDGISQEQLSGMLGKEPHDWIGTIATWHQMQLVLRVPNGSSYRISIATRMDREMRGKCSYCGAERRALYWKLLESLECARCRKLSLFTLLPTDERK